MKTKGLIVDILTDKDRIDCTNSGISSYNTRLILTSVEVGTAGNIRMEVPQIFEGDETNSVKIIENVVGHFCAVPLKEKPEGMIGPMFGGNFIYTSDSRFPFKYPIPIHDRYEVYHD